MAPEAAQDAAVAPPPAETTTGPSGWGAFYERHKPALWAGGLLLPVLVVAAGVLVRPELFYDRFIWAHLWGSAVADAGQTGAVHNGIAVTDDYTLIAELVYGAILAVSIYGIYVHVLKRFQVRVDAWFVAAILPFILYGPVTRTLEDTGLFCRAGTSCDPSAFAYLFISPFLYAQIAAYVLVFIVAGALMDRSSAPSRTKTLAMAGLLGASFGLYGLVWATLGGEFTLLAHPAVVLVSCALGLGLFVALQTRGVGGVNRSLAAGGIAFLLPGLWLIAQWLAGQPWGPTLLGDGRMHLEATPYILGLPLLAVLAVGAAGRFGRRADERLGAFAMPLNLGLVYGHMLDGFASFIAICSNPAGFCKGATVFGLTLPSYGEKHPVSNLMLGSLDGWLFPIVKLALVVGIIWALDVMYRKDLEKEPQLGGLVKMAILVLGLAPGLRDYLRLAMGT